MADQYFDFTEVRLCSADHEILNRIAKALENIAGAHTLEATIMAYEKGMLSHDDVMNVVGTIKEIFDSRK